MAKLNRTEIRDLAKSIVKGATGGIRYSDLLTRIVTDHPETPRNSIAGAIYDLQETFEGEVAKPSRGLFTWLTAGSVPTVKTGPVVPPEPAAREQDFYESFAEWLKNDLDEATEAIALGGGGLRGKWGTPDVLGTFKPVPSNRVKFEPEIISAEIKTNASESITAFGQATAYRLFSHKVYLVMPRTLPEEDRSRIAALAMLFGIGLVLFDVNVNDPKYDVQVRDQRFSPDMFYVNEFADRLHDHNKQAFNRLFQ